ncbi:MAG: serine/threonine-protein kinase [Acidobacteria bacterium]|nr:serine/threonine-protein kinase [Acidobacteriota bacterium]
MEESDGARFLVLELVEGETLDERLKAGALSVDEAVRVAIEIAEALEAAHDKGVIHRDLKPANIKITPEGRVKVLDFGLARAVRTTPSGSNFSNSPTMSVVATREGIVLGTAPYMSPEQAKGRSVDRRSDIFSFGCVLYEMLAGRRAFDGEDATEVVSRILQRDPDWSALPSGVYPALRQVLNDCLEKDVNRRRRDIGDVRMDLQRASRANGIVASTSRPTKHASIAWSLIALLSIALASSIVLNFRDQSSGATELRLEMNTPSSPQPLHFALSPEGSRVVFVASGDGPQRLWLRSFNSAVAEPLAGTENAEFPFWSPDGRSIGFFAGGWLKRIDVSGGPPQNLA